jgi:hypothetical protein
VSRQRGGARDEGVSTVLGAVLMFGLLVITLVTIQTRFVPVWDEDREAAHMDEVLGQFARIASDVDRQVRNDTTVSVADPVRLGRSPGFRFFGGSAAPATLAFQAPAAGSGVALASERLTVYERNGEQLVALVDPSAWIPLDNHEDAYADIQRLRVLRVQIPWPTEPNDCDTDLVATLAIRDALGAEMARIVMTCHDAVSERSISTAVFRRSSATGPFSQVSGDTEAIFQNAEADFFYVDLMRSELLLSPILASMRPPLSMEMTDQGLAASYVLVYDDASGGTVGGGGNLVGQAVAPYPETPTLYGGGALVLRSLNQRFVDQSYVFEHGGVLRVQAEGAVMAVPPRFEVRPTSLATRIDWDLPSLRGVTQALAGASSATVTSDRSGPGLQMLAGAASLTLDVPTAHPAAWEAFFERELEESGLAASAYEVAADDDSVTVRLHGASADPDVDDLLLSFSQADIDIDLSSSG